ncbi:MAG: glycosyltransferase family 2 protein [Nitrosomonadales bacterium]|nr:glycosyltransferase family 2 protein [Nitrosomonadales bacterium]
MKQESPSLMLSVVIINFRTPKFVIDCLKTLLPELDGVDGETVVVDNHSGDDSPGIIRDWLARHDAGGKVIFVESEHNSGFSGGNNTGIQSLKARYYLLLNSDTLIRPGAIRIMLDTAMRFPEAGLVSPRLEWPDGVGQESCFRFPAPASELISAAQTGLVSECFSRYVVALPVQTQIVRPQWTSFACVLVKDEVFRQAGLMDDGYFMYFEDIEFCHRARKAGWDIVHNPEARVVHLCGGSSPVTEQTRLKKRLPRYYYESRTRYYYQTYGRLGLLGANLLWWLGRIVSGARQLLGRPDKAAIEGKWLDIWTNWLHPLKHSNPPKT